jgi:drug/metabolite transporter (DMT)-like permease
MLLLGVSGGLMLSKRAKTYLSDAGLLYAALIWGVTFILVKEAVEFVNPIVLVGYRFAISAFVLGIYIILSERSLKQGLKEGIILGVILWLVYIPQTIGIQYTSAANSGFITGLFVVFVPIISFLFFKVTPSIYRLLSVILAFVGLWLLTGGYNTVNKGDIITLMSAVSYACHILVADKFVKKEVDLFVISFHQFWVITVLCFAIVPILNLNLVVTDVKTIRVIVFLALFPTLSAFVIQLVAQKNTLPIKISLIFTMEPVFAAIFAWTYGNEPFVFKSAIGGLFIVVAMIVSELPTNTKST